MNTFAFLCHTQGTYIILFKGWIQVYKCALGTFLRWKIGIDSLRVFGMISPFFKRLKFSKLYDDILTMISLRILVRIFSDDVPIIFPRVFEQNSFHK